MYLTREPSRHFDASQVIDPDHRGAVAWNQFNHHFAELITRDWRRINDGPVARPAWLRLLRRILAWGIHRRDAFLDLERKARVLWRFAPAMPRDPRIVFFGAEAGWEALLVDALFATGQRSGRVVLIDVDPAAHQRFLAGPAETRVKAPRGFPGGTELVLVRDPARVEYVQQDFFTLERPAGFDVGIDWGLLEHFPDPAKGRLLARLRQFLAPGGVQISSVPRDCLALKLFYRAFRDELNFGYRELLTPAEHAARLEAGGLQVLDQVTMPTNCVALTRPRA